jgi:hypothetical protein
MDKHAKWRSLVCPSSEEYGELPLLHGTFGKKLPHEIPEEMNLNCKRLETLNKETHGNNMMP